jgi:uncharacterized protein (DUF58 family)
MDRKWPRIAATALAVVAGLLSVGWAAYQALPARLGGSSAGSSAPMLAVPYDHHDFGTVHQGVVVRMTFPVRNTGNRRLVLLEDQQPCCGQLSDRPRVIVAPGRTEELAVEVDTAQSFGSMEHTAFYTTNDPLVPRFGLSVTAEVIEGRGR